MAGDSPADTQQRLLRDIAEAEAAYLQAVRDQIPVISATGELPAADGVFRIQQKAKVRRMAFERYKAARKAFSDFIATGWSPPLT